MCSAGRGKYPTPACPLAQFLSLFSGFRCCRHRHRCLPHRVPCAATSCSPPPWRRRSAQSTAGAGCPRAGGWGKVQAGAVSLHGALPASLSSGLPPIADYSPGPAMGNVPSAVKHCLSYQQLLREHLWIADSVAGALDPAQVPPRGPGCPHPLAHCHPASPPVSQLCTPGPFLQPSVVLGLTL